MSKIKKRLKLKLNSIAKNNLFFRGFIRRSISIYKEIKYIAYLIKYKTDDNLVLFECFNGKSFADSPKAIYLEMLNNKKYDNFTFVWSFYNVDKYKEEFKNEKRVVLVRTNSKKYLEYLSKAKYFFTNSITPEGYVKKKNQVCVQCWHGTPLKRLRCDIKVEGSKLNTLKETKKRNKSDIRNIDYFISPSKFASEKFISAFDLVNLKKCNIILETGYPRNDILFKKNDVNIIKQKYKIPTDKKIILYAPTFRDNQHKTNYGYTLNLSLDFDNLKNKFSKDHVILFRTHYFISNQFDFGKYKDFIYDVSSVDDINELYLISDILVTDYSSVFFDFANLKRPILFYMYDLKEYKNDIRGFYLDLKDLPGPIIESEEELILELSRVDDYWGKYNKKYSKFNKKYNYLDDSNSSKRVLESVIKK